MRLGMLTEAQGEAVITALAQRALADAEARRGLAGPPGEEARGGLDEIGGELPRKVDAVLPSPDPRRRAHGVGGGGGHWGRLW